VQARGGSWAEANGMKHAWGYIGDGVYRCGYCGLDRSKWWLLGLWRPTDLRFHCSGPS
jgi:hypothetical protein